MQGAPASNEICMLGVGDIYVSSVACDIPVIDDRLSIYKAAMHLVGSESKRQGGCKEHAFHEATARNRLAYIVWQPH